MIFSVFLLVLLVQLLNASIFQNFHFFYSNLVRAQAICHFNVNKTIPLLNRKGYKKAMMELELILNVPTDASLFTKT